MLLFDKKSPASEFPPFFKSPALFSVFSPITASSGRSTTSNRRQHSSNNRRRQPRRLSTRTTTPTSRRTEARRAEEPAARSCEWTQGLCVHTCRLPTETTTTSRRATLVARREEAVVSSTVFFSGRVLAAPPPTPVFLYRSKRTAPVCVEFPFFRGKARSEVCDGRKIKT